MTIERWQMPSGRIAVIDLDQSSEQIHQARQLLAEHGGATKVAPVAVDVAGMVEVVVLDILRVTGRLNDHALQVLYAARADAYPGVPTVSDAAVLAARISLNVKGLITLANGSIELWELAPNKKAPAPLHRGERRTPTKGINS